MRYRFWFAAPIVALAGVAGVEAAPLHERAPIHYAESEPDTVVTRLFERAGREGLLSGGSDREILRELLDELDVPVESQVLVYSKTSAQNSRISPETPRAIYFSDDVYVGWANGGEIELASFDEKLGMVFHLVKLTGREEGRPPELIRDRSCLNCHAGSSNRELPGLMVRSVHPKPSGLPEFRAGTFHTRHDSPIEERWGGWYVTGEVEGLLHMGNAVVPEGTSIRGEVEMKRLVDGPVSALEGVFDADAYLHGARSDVVALMVLEHQVGVHNALVEANLTVRTTRHRHREMQKAFDESPDAPLSDTNRRVLENAADRVLREMLWVDEAPVPDGIQGGDAFQDAFRENRRDNAEGRSLKDFRLYARVMKYRCSHLIYSRAFEHLPDGMRDLILRRLHRILTQPGEHPDFDHLSESECDYILAILGETLPDLPAVWDRPGVVDG